MSLIDSILNLAGLLLWLNWLSLRYDPLARPAPKSLVGTLRKADPAGPRRWLFLAGLAALLLLRALVYWTVGPAANWTPALRLGAIVLSFRSDFPDVMFVFSALSFALTLGIFYLWLLLVSAANSGVAEPDPILKLVRLHFGWLERWPRAVKLLLPWLAAGALWLALHPLLARIAVVPRVKTSTQLFEQAGVIGLGAYLTWEYFIAAILLLHLVSSYVYFGNSPFWLFVNTTAGNLLRPLRWLPLRVGKVDFAPLLAMAVVFLIAEPGAAGLARLYARLLR